jgi:hypothetical protein
MNIFQWAMVVLGFLGFAGTWLIGAFTLGRAVEQLKSALKKEIDQERKAIMDRFDLERNKIIDRIEIMERRFEADQKQQDHNFGEVGIAMRQYIADVEKKVREVEIYGRDNYVKIPEFEKAMDRLSIDLKSFVAEIKKDFSERITELKGQLK